MKYLVIIFSIYMTVLTLMPCQDKEDFASIKKGTSSLQKQSKADEHAEQELCPPFCTCSCCSVSRDFIQEVPFVVVVSQIQAQYAAYRIPAVAEQCLSIYQPPKIA